MAIENFLAWNEQDPEFRILRTAPRVAWTHMDRRQVAGAFVWRDFGAGHFGDFQHLLDFHVTQIEAGDPSSRYIMAPYYLQDQNVWNPPDKLAIDISQDTNVDDKCRFNFLQLVGGVVQFVWSSPWRMAPLTRYLTIERTGINSRLRIYTDAARTILDMDSGNRVGVVDTYRYCHVSTGYNFVKDPGDWSTGWVENLDLQEPVAAGSGSVAALAAAMKLTRMVPWRKRFPQLRPLRV